jgi:hypothetical protein
LWWPQRLVSSVDHERVVERVIDGSSWSGRYAFMVMMSASIAVLDLLLSSPAVVIGAMLISPLMSPILGLGFSLALFDFAEMRRSLTALAIRAVTAVVHRADRPALSVEGTHRRDPRPHPTQPVRSAGRAVRGISGHLRDHPGARRDDRGARRFACIIVTNFMTIAL